MQLSGRNIISFNINELQIFEANRTGKRDEQLAVLASSTIGICSRLI